MFAFIVLYKRISLDWARRRREKMCVYSFLQEVSHSVWPAAGVKILVFIVSYKRNNLRFGPPQARKFLELGGGTGGGLSFWDFGGGVAHRGSEAEIM